ncbi:hypothetical protein [Methylobacterium sp. WL19]|uniref:hypothetical protein n=1 Tax=Methylobacterium sp. WL19 TaxID=2603896 RepID=UPI0011CAF572|nr:hypothetical protein [Methylobacterium sp. WL19]TXN33923.1 hypothetical protein FV220_00300 [Methylobacterium sp. WL19]
MAQDNCAVIKPVGIGDVFGRLTIIGGPYKEKSKVRWQCRCECGSTKDFRHDHIRSGATISCGCAYIKHGHSLSGKKTAEYDAWTNMHQRCSNPNHFKYKDYGARGIVVCERWNSFETFIHDMGMRPEGLSLERINNDAGYSPENCKWATYAEQMKNRRAYRRRVA